MVQQLNNLKGIYRISVQEQPVLDQYARSVPAGLPEEVNINACLATRPGDSFVMRMQDDSMTEANIPANALLIINREITPLNNMIVAAIVDGEMTVKRFIKNSSGIRLMPASQKYKPIPITEKMDFRVWGVVTKSIIDTLPVY